MSKQKTNKNNTPGIGIRWKTGLSVGLIVILVSAFSFSLAVYLHVAVSFSTATDIDLYSGRQIIKELDQAFLTNLFKEGKKIYDSTPEKIRKNPRSKEYLSRYKKLDTEEYKAVKKQLVHLAEFENLKWLDLRFADWDNKRWVYLMDTEVKKDGRYALGYWEGGKDAVLTFRESTKEEAEREKKIWFPIRNLLDMMNFDFRKMDKFSTVSEVCDPDTGEVIGYVGTGELFRDYKDDLSTFWILLLLATLLFLVVFFLASDISINHWLVSPIMELASAATNYVSDSDKAQNTHHFDKVPIRTRDELWVLKDSMVNMEEELARYVKDIEHMTAEREREATEMELSARIQSSLLPSELGDFDGEKNFAVSTLIDPAKEVGGDFYDYYVIDDDHIGITIADVSDKGVPAALFMMVTKTLLQAAGMMSLSPSEVLEKVNRQLGRQNQEMMFVTVFFGIYTVSERKLVYVNAGHEDMALYKEREGRFALKVEEHDFVLAGMPDTEFTEHTLYLEPGDRLFLYTDGVPEAKNPKEELFGEERMINELNDLKDLPGEELLQGLRQRIRDFAGSAGQFDDVTMLLLDIDDHSGH